ncbi:ribonuclease H-like domain-containing protein, partial [Tanacetum coccineum]
MQKNVLKHQFENFTTAPNESLDKAYDRFQKLISQLEVYAAPVSKEDINQKFLRSLPPSWSQIALIMRNKPDIDQTDIDDLYNNLRVYEDEMKRSSSSTSNSQNLAFLSSENTSRTNEVSTASGNFGVNTAGGTNSSSQVSSTPGADEVIDKDDLEELDLRWQSKIECYNCHRKGHFARECRSGRNQGRRSYGDNGRSNAPTNESSSQALVAQDGLGGYDWSNDFEVEPVNYALMAISSSSSSSSSDNEGYELALESLESRILGHEKNELAWGENMSLDEYAIRKKIIESKTTKLNADTSKSKTSETVGNINEVKIKKPKSVNESVVSIPNINKDKVIIKDWNSDNEDDVSEVSPVKTNETQTAKTQVDKIGQTSKKARIGFKKIKACFVCKSTDHLIKDCDFYDKKSPEPKLKNVVNTGQRVVKPIWDNAKRVNHQNFSNKLNYPQARRTFVPSRVLTRTGLITPVKQNEKRVVYTVSTTRPVSTARPVSTVRPFSPKIAQTSSVVRPIYTRMDNVRPRASSSRIKRSYYTKPAFRPKNLKQDVKTFGIKNMTIVGTRAVVNTGKGKMENDLKKSKACWISEVPNTEEPRVNQEQDANVNSTNNINTVSPTVNVVDIENNDFDENIVYGCDDDPNMPNLEDIIYSNEGFDVKADITNLHTHILVSPTPTTRIHKDHTLEQIIGDIHSTPQTRRMTKSVTDHVEPKKAIQALQDLSWIEAMQEELLQNKKDKRGIVIRNKARIEAIRLFLVYTSFKDIVMYQIEVNSAFLYGKIEEEVYVCQPLGFEDPEFPDKVYKVEKALYGLHQAPKACQDKYVDEILKKFGFSNIKTASTPMETSKSLLKDTEVEDVIFQVTPKVLHLHAVKRIFRYLKGQPKLGLWYPKDLPFNLEAYTDSNYAGASLDKKSTTRADETVIKEWEDRMEKAATTASSLEAEQDSGNINRTQSMATLNESFPQGTDSGCGPRCQDTILGGAEAQIRFEALSKQSNDPSLSRVNTYRSGEDNMKLKELMEFCTKL